MRHVGAKVVERDSFLCHFVRLGRRPVRRLLASPGQLSLDVVPAAVVPDVRVDGATGICAVETGAHDRFVRDPSAQRHGQEREEHLAPARVGRCILGQQQCPQHGRQLFQIHTGRLLCRLLGFRRVGRVRRRKRGQWMSHSVEADQPGGAGSAAPVAVTAPSRKEWLRLLFRPRVGKIPICLLQPTGDPDDESACEGKRNPSHRSGSCNRVRAARRKLPLNGYLDR